MEMVSTSAIIKRHQLQDHYFDHCHYHQICHSNYHLNFKKLNVINILSITILILFNYNQNVNANLNDLEKISFLLNVTYHENYKPFNAGQDIDGQDLFICRTRKFGQIIPGKYSHNIGKCSIAQNQKEMQFNQFELLIEGQDTKYEWVRLKKPVTDLPANVLFGGKQYSGSFKSDKLQKTKQDKNLFKNILSDDLLYNRVKRRRFRRNVNEIWSRNWRGVVRDYHLRKFEKYQHNQQFREIPLFDRKCIEEYSSPSGTTTTEVSVWTPLQNKCIDEKRKLNYFIAKCSLRTGDKISEQIGKIWWKNNIQEWIASFPFGGHEIYCLDYSVLTLKTK